MGTVAEPPRCPVGVARRHKEQKVAPPANAANSAGKWTKAAGVAIAVAVVSLVVALANTGTLLL